MTLPKRSKRYGVGKEIGGAIYVHQLYERVLGEAVPAARRRLPAGWRYTIVKLHLARRIVTFVQSPDWDDSPEPTVGDCWTVRADGTVTFRRQADDPFIYHHKWLFVAEGYDGFDVSASVEHSRRWMALANVDRSRIGRKSYWLREVVPRLVDKLSAGDD